MRKRANKAVPFSFVRAWVIVPLLLVVVLATDALPSVIRIKFLSADGITKDFPLYSESHALLIGVSDYSAGWPDLESIPYELNKLEHELKEQGFNVVKIMNPNHMELFRAYEDFIDQYGYKKENRLLFFYSGHGYSRKNGTKGYIVPSDAPNPLEDEIGFLRKALDMGRIINWARVIESKHALFMFDSCFSGTIFKTKALPKIPPHISDITTRPVRQFITAGSAGEEVPSQSTFLPFFLRALQGEGDLDSDGYVTGTELGMYLHNKVLDYNSRQTPQYGKIRDPELDEGDFVFVGPSPIKEPKSAKNTELQVHEKSDADKLWDEIKGAGNIELLQVFINMYPDSDKVPIAKSLVTGLKAQREGMEQIANSERPEIVTPQPKQVANIQNSNETEEKHTQNAKLPNLGKKENMVVEENNLKREENINLYIYCDVISWLFPVVRIEIDGHEYVSEAKSRIIYEINTTPGDHVLKINLDELNKSKEFQISTTDDKNYSLIIQTGTVVSPVDISFKEITKEEIAKLKFYKKYNKN